MCQARLVFQRAGTGAADGGRSRGSAGKTPLKQFFLFAALEVPAFYENMRVP